MAEIKTIYIDMFDGVVGANINTKKDPKDLKCIPQYKPHGIKGIFKKCKFKDGALRINQKQCVIKIDIEEKIYEGQPDALCFIIPNTELDIDYESTIFAKLMQHQTNEVTAAHQKVIEVQRKLHFANEKIRKLEIPKRTASSSQSNMVTCNECGTQMSRQELSVSGGRCNKCEKIINM